MQIKTNQNRTEQNYQAALSRLETLWDTPEGTDEFDQLEAYECKHFLNDSAC